MDDPLIALYHAPRDRAVHGVLRERVDTELQRRAIQRRPGRAVMIGGTADGIAETLTEVWIDGDSRSRVDHLDTGYGRSVRIAHGDDVIAYTPGQGAIASTNAVAHRYDVSPQLWCRPRPLLGMLDIDTSSDDVVLGRPCWRLDARSDGPRTLMAPLQLFLTGERFTVWVDKESGVVLRCVQRIAAGDVSTMEWTTFEAVDRIADEVFVDAFPPDVKVRSQAEAMAELARRRGADLTGVDTTDADEIARAMHAVRHGGPLDHHVAVGPPPSDRGAAETAIRVAYANLSHADGDSLPNVQEGGGLAPTAELAAQRASQRDADIAVGQIRFLSDARAAVVFTVSSSDGHPLLTDTVGEAVLHNGRWRVARSTFANLMRLAGVELPHQPET
ncbi:MAG: hypothetical protein AAGA42_09020 [Actinomycetota bacterium]